MRSSPSRPDYRCVVGVDIAATTFTTSWTTDGRTLPQAVTFAQIPHRLRRVPTATPGYG